MGRLPEQLHLEKHYERSGTIIALEPVEQWFWVREGMFGEWQYNQDARSGQRTGKSIKRSDFVIFEIVAMNRICCVPYFRKNVCEQDWDDYLAVYGVPSVFLIGPPNANTLKNETYQELADDIMSDGRGFLPKGSDIKFVDGGSKKPPYIERIEYLDKQIVLAGTGGLLTMLAQAGSGTLAGGAHQDTFSQIAEADAAALSGVLQEQFDLPLLEAFYPGREKLAYFEFAKAPGRDANQVVQDVSGLVDAGFRLDPKEVSEKSRYKGAAAVKPEVRGPMSARNRYLNHGLTRMNTDRSVCMENSLILNRDFTLPADGYYQIAPLGEFSNAAAGVLQVIDRAACDAMAARFAQESTVSNFGGVLVDFDHGSLDTAKSSEASGWVTALQVREAGLFANIRWSDTGEAAVKGGRYRYVSPVWARSDCEDLGPDPQSGRERVRPLRLLNLAVTNDPNLKGMVPLSNRSQNSEFRMKRQRRPSTRGSGSSGCWVRR